MGASFFLSVSSSLQILSHRRLMQIANDDYDCEKVFLPTIKSGPAGRTAFVNPTDYILPFP